MEIVTEQNLIVACQEGSEKAFKELVQKYYQQAYAMALVMTQNKEAAFDISQEAFLRIYRNFSSFDVRRSFKAWLFTIVKNLSLNYLERKKRRWITFTDFFKSKNKPDIFTEDFPETIERSEIRQQVLWALKQLGEQDRDIILLRDFESFSYQEISDILEIPVGTVMSRLYYARKKLARIIKEEHNESSK